MKTNARKIFSVVVIICLISAGCSESNSNKNRDIINPSRDSSMDNTEEKRVNDKETIESTSQKQDNAEENYSNSDELCSDSFETELETEETEECTEEINVLDEYDEYSIIDYYTPFVNGTAWVNANAGSFCNHPVIINRDGIVVFDTIGVLFESVEKANLGWHKFQCMKDGTVCLFCDYGIYIIDSNGNLLFNYKDYVESSKFYFCDYVNDHIFMIEDESDYYANKYYVCEFDYQGQLISKHEIEIDFSIIEKPDFSFEYVNDGYFAVGASESFVGHGTYYIYNQNTHNFIDVKMVKDMISEKVQNKEIKIVGVDFRLSSFEVLDIIGNVIICRWGNGIFRIELVNDSIGSVALLGFVDYLRGDLYVSNGIINYAPSYKPSEEFLSAGLYNYDGELLSEYSDIVIVDSESFLDGKAFLIVKGADGEKYVTRINDHAEFLFEPIKIDKYVFPSYEGNLMVSIKNETKIITENGEVDDVLSLHKPDCIVTIGNTTLSDGFSISFKDFNESMPDYSKPISLIGDEKLVDGFTSMDGRIIDKVYIKK